MELKQAGNLLVMLYEMEQAARSTCRNCDPKNESIKGNDKLIASGPVSFAKIYSTLNEILRRGGTYRNGAIVCHLDLSHPDAFEFISASRSDFRGSNDASTSPPNGGRGVRLKRNSLRN